MNELAFDDLPKLNQQDARKYLAYLRWGEWASCPYCANTKAYIIENGERYKCANKECHKKFSVTVKTLLQASNIGYDKIIHILYRFIKTRGNYTSFDIEKEIDLDKKAAFILLDKLKFCYTSIVGEDNLKKFIHIFKAIVDNYYKWEDFKSKQYQIKFHITDDEINDLTKKEQIDRLTNYIDYYINVYADWIWIDFTTPNDVMSEVLLYMYDNNIKEFNGSRIIKIIWRVVDMMWKAYLNGSPKHRHLFDIKKKLWAENRRINLTTYYVVEIAYKKFKGEMTRSEIKATPGLIDKTRTSILAYRKKHQKNYDFHSHFE